MKAELSLAQLAAAVMPLLAWARLATVEPEVLGLGLGEAPGLTDVPGVAEEAGVLGMTEAPGVAEPAAA